MTEYIKILTLVDITDTGVTRVRDNTTKEYHQNQNLNALLQVVGLRTQPLDPQVYIAHQSAKIDRLSSMYGFGNKYEEETAKVWALEFHVENQDIWREEDNPVALLKKDVHGVAITGDLDNTVDFLINIFDTQINPNIVIYTQPFF